MSYSFPCNTCTLCTVIHENSTSLINKYVALKALPSATKNSPLPTEAPTNTVALQASAHKLFLKLIPLFTIRDSSFFYQTKPDRYEY